MEQTQLDNLINTIENTLVNGIRVQLGNDFNGSINLDSNINPANLGLNVNGYITVENPETRIQSYRKLLDSLIATRNQPNFAKKLLREDYTLDDSIDKLIKLIQNEIEKQIEKEGLN